MAGTEPVLDLRIVLGALVGVFDKQRNRRPGRFLDTVLVNHDTGQDLHLIRLAPLRGEAGLARLALVHKALNIGLRQGNERRAAVHHATDSGTVAFAPGGNPEKMTKTVMRHER